MADKNKLYCPNWLYEVSVSMTIHDFLLKSYSIEMISKKFADGLSEEYNDIPFEEIAKPAEEIIRFMAEMAGMENQEFEAHESANHFTHYILKFDGLKGPRKMKGLFGSAFDGTKEKKYNEVKIVKDFKAFTFALRSKTVPMAPSGWSLKNEKEIDFLVDIAGKDFSLDDML